MAQNELHWDELGLKGLGREQRRQELAEAYRAHMEAGDLFYPYVVYPYVGVVFRNQRTGGARVGSFAGGDP